MSDLTTLVESGKALWVVVDYADTYEVHFMRETYTADEVRRLLVELWDHMVEVADE